MKAKSCVLLFWVAFSAISLSLPLKAAEFPERAIHLVVGYPPGGGADLIARLIAAALSEKIGQPVVVDNRPGAGTAIAADYVAHSKPDGYTLFLYGQPLTLPRDTKTNFDPVTSFSPIILLAQQPGMLITNGSLPVNSLQEFIALAKSKPAQFNFGSAGSDSPASMMIKLIMKHAGIDLVEIPYTGEARVVAGMLGNEVQLGIVNPTTALPTVKDGSIKALAVTSKTRSPLAPDVPSVAEAADYPTFDNALWYGVAGPAGVPPAVLDKLHTGLAAAMANPELVKNMTGQGLIMLGGSPEDFSRKITDTIALWSTVEK